MPGGSFYSGIFFLLTATVFLILASISTPDTTKFDVVRVHFDNQNPSSPITPGPAATFDLGIWGFCVTDAIGDKKCRREVPYSISTISPVNGRTVEIRKAWTRGLELIPFSATLSIVALLLACCPDPFILFLATWFSFFAAFITLVTFAAEVGFVALVIREMHHLDVGAHVRTGPGFWFPFVALILLTFGASTVCIGRPRHHRHDPDNAEASTPDRVSWFDKIIKRKVAY